MKFKEGVSIIGLRPELIAILPAIDEVYRSYGADVELIVTSACEGKHVKNSRHYIGCAIDCRTRTVPGTYHQQLAEKIREAITKDFLVLVETNHIHISLKPQ